MKKRPAKPGIQCYPRATRRGPGHHAANLDDAQALITELRQRLKPQQPGGELNSQIATLQKNGDQDSPRLICKRNCRLQWIKPTRLKHRKGHRRKHETLDRSAAAEETIIQLNTDIRLKGCEALRAQDAFDALQVLYAEQQATRAGKAPLPLLP